MSEGAMNAACVSQKNFPVGLFVLFFPIRITQNLSVFSFFSLKKTYINIYLYSLVNYQRYLVVESFFGGFLPVRSINVGGLRRGTLVSAFVSGSRSYSK